ncbi:unnamed protein product [Hermetia illucens]|uniref:Uncharacterized protein n=1 Tax=Hermetia illucens TaxID=343691 RepID=A0A7R8YLG1_HERIL|nr:unnamed protein product [Hermetia illucens]
MTRLVGSQVKDIIKETTAKVDRAYEKEGRIDAQIKTFFIEIFSCFLDINFINTRNTTRPPDSCIFTYANIST